MFKSHGMNYENFGAPQKDGSNRPFLNKFDLKHWPNCYSMAQMTTYSCLLYFVSKKEMEYRAQWDWSTYSRLLISRCLREIKINIDLSIHLLIRHPPKEQNKGDNLVGQLHNDFPLMARKIDKDRTYYQSLKCKDSFVFACPEKDILFEEKRGCNEIGDWSDLYRLDLESSPHCVVLHLTNLSTRTNCTLINEC